MLHVDRAIPQLSLLGKICPQPTSLPHIPTHSNVIAVTARQSLPNAHTTSVTVIIISNIMSHEEYNRLDDYHLSAIMEQTCETTKTI